MAQGAVGYVGDVQLAGGGDEAVCFVEGFEGGVFGLDGVDFGDWRREERSGQWVCSSFSGWRHRSGRLLEIRT